MPRSTDRTMWIVKKPTPDSTLLDIVFCTDPEGLAMQFKFGLQAGEVAGVFKDEAVATRLAERLLEQRGVGL